MSRWTHVNGLIRVNAICSNFKNNEILEDIQKCFGTTIPCGSEGSLQYEFIELKEENSINCGVIAIHGDLREYWNKDEIVNWIKIAISSSEIWWVRSLCIKIDIDDEKSIILIDSDDDRLEVINI